MHNRLELFRRDRPCDKCSPPYGFRHEMSLSQEAHIFKTRVNASQISGNLDAPEGGFDGLMQALVHYYYRCL
jgi:integrin beta 1